MKQLSFSLLLISVLCSCAAPTRMENRDLEQLYQGAGVERYFMADLPAWANFSASASCKRDAPVRYLNFSTLRASYSLDYENLIHFQHMLNRRFMSFRQTSEAGELYLKDEAFIFYNVYEQVAGGSKDFNPPRFDRISLIWIDPYLEDLKKVGRILQREEVMQGHPVLISSCHSTFTMEELAEEHGWDKMGVRNIGQEMFSPFHADYSLGHDYFLDFPAFLPNKSLYLFAPYLPKHFKGIKKFKEIQ